MRLLGIKCLTWLGAGLGAFVSLGRADAAVSLAGPASNSVLAAPANIALTASVAGAAGTVTNVAFYAGSNLLGTVTGAPASFTTPNLFAGSYALTAVATDNTGATSTSGVVNVTITNTAALDILQQVKTVFVIAMENHDLVQANPEGNPQQIFGNPAAPYFNSLITPGNSNAAQVSWATHYFSTARGEHPSEPNYIWSEAGTEFGSHTDNDPNLAWGNLFTNCTHLSGQLTAAGIPWRSYQEDLQYSPSPTVSLSGSGVPVNPYNGTSEYFYVTKHNPMQFFTDTQGKNCYPLTNFWTDLTNNNIGRYNWITPDQFNEWHSALPNGFLYHGVQFTGDQAGIAQGDNCLSIIIPKIMASAAYQSNGMIIIWTDETESTDDTNTTLPYVIISPLAKGNAYASTLPYCHSSDLKTMDEIFGLAYQTNAITSGGLNAQGTGYNYVNGSSAAINDLSDFLKPLNGTTNISIQAGTITTGSTGTNSSTNTTTTTSSPSTNATVTVPGSAAGQFTRAGFQLTFSGVTNQTYEIFAATNLALPLANWSLLGAGTFTGPSVVFTDTNAAGYSRRFYTIKSP